MASGLPTERKTMSRNTRINSAVTHGNLALERVLRNLQDSIGAGYPGNIYYVAQADTDYYSVLYDAVYQKYNDGSVSIHNTIQGAVDAAKELRGDVIYVMPDKWKEQVVIEDKGGLKIFGVMHGWETQMRSGDATTKYPWTPAGTPTGALTGGAAFYVLSRSVEIAGFCFDGGGGYSGIYVGDGDVVAGLASTNNNAASVWIHDNLFEGQGEGHYGIDLEGCGSGAVIEHNVFNKWTKDAIRVGSYSSRSNQAPVIRENDFLAGNSGYGVDIINIAGGNVNTLVSKNTFRDGKSLAFTAAVNSVTTDGVTGIIGNHFGTVLSIIAQATDRVSGNYFVTNGNATPASNDYVTEEVMGEEN